MSTSRCGVDFIYYDNARKESANYADNLKGEASCGTGQPYRPYTFGEILHEKDGNYKWKKYPSEENEIAKRMLSDAKEFLSYHYDKVILHGMKFGKGMKTIAVPRYSKGILMIWPARQDWIFLVGAQLGRLPQPRALLPDRCRGDLPHLLLRLLSLQPRGWSTACEDHEEDFAAG